MEILLASQNTTNFNLSSAIQIALLHDTLEDTNTTYEELENEFGKEVAKGVLALTKNDKLPKNEKMLDSLNRTKQLQIEVWAVKLADRITNMQTPPTHWDNVKKQEYKIEAEIILEILNGCNQYLENRLLNKIEEYNQYIEK